MWIAVLLLLAGTFGTFFLKEMFPELRLFWSCVRVGVLVAALNYAAESQDENSPPWLCIVIFLLMVLQIIAIIVRFCINPKVVLEMERPASVAVWVFVGAILGMSTFEKAIEEAERHKLDK